MKNSKLTKSIMAVIAFAILALPALAVSTIATAQSMTDQDAVSLTDKRLHRRAVESVLWGQPIASYWAMRNACRTTFNYELNDVLFFSKPADWKYKFLTLNNTTLYSYVFFNINKDGPVVIEIPKTTKDIGLFGSIMNSWQQAFADFGGQGSDRGMGGKYLVMHKDYQGPVPAGYIPFYQNTYNGWLLGRTLVKDLKPETLKKAEKFIKQMKVYPLSQAGKQAEQRFYDGSGILLNGVPPYNHKFFYALNEMIQEEQVADRDKVAMGMLKDLLSDHLPHEEPFRFISKSILGIVGG